MLEASMVCTIISLAFSVLGFALVFAQIKTLADIKEIVGKNGNPTEDLSKMVRNERRELLYLSMLTALCVVCAILMMGVLRLVT